jgi:hypothetical protein
MVERYARERRATPNESAYVVVVVVVVVVLVVIVTRD